MADDDLQEGGAIPPKLSPITVKAPEASAVAPPPAPTPAPAEPAAAPAAVPEAAAPSPAVTPAAATPPTVTTTKRPVITRKPVVLRKPGEKPATPAPAAAPAAIPAAEPPKAAAVAPEGIAISHAEAAKKMTARISLASATGEIPEITQSEDEVKTIKLRPPSQPVPASVQAAKSKTSRISLDTALNNPEAEPAASGPRTIRLKRPTEMGKSGDASAEGKPAPSITTELTPPPADAPATVPVSDEAPSQKKTIKVKRPTAAGGPKISISKGEASSAQPAAGGDGDLQSLSSFDQVSAAPVADKVNPFFIVAAVIAILVTLNLAWIFSAQLFGPNAAVADFSVAQGPDIPDPIGALRVQ